MPYIALRQLKADGITYEPGQEVPAAGWKTKNALISRRWIAEGTPTVAGPDQGNQGAALSPLSQETGGELTKEQEAILAEFLALPLENALQSIQAITDEDMVKDKALIDAIAEKDTRGEVKAAIEARKQAYEVTLQDMTAKLQIDGQAADLPEVNAKDAKPESIAPTGEAQEKDSLLSPEDEKRQQIIAAAKAIQEMNVERLSAAVKEVTDIAVLQFILETDERKTAKAAVQERIEALETVKKLQETGPNAQKEG